MAGGGDDAMLIKVERHATAVRALAFNPHPQMQHLLAAASTDGDLSIISLETPAQPTIANPLPAGTKAEAEITSLAWNPNVAHILACATTAGTVCVWDLKENRPWCTLKDPNRSPIADIAWHPEDGLFMVTACDDDARPLLRLWDLRSSTTTPLAEFHGHTKGMLGVHWCPHDHNLLVSCGKDGHTFIWDIAQGRAVMEVPAAAGAGAGAGSGGAAGSPAHARGSRRARCASEPLTARLFTKRSECARYESAKAGSLAASSSCTMATAVASIPAPPCSASAVRPSRPSSLPRRRKSARLKASARSCACACGSTSRSAKARTEARSAACSGEGVYRSKAAAAEPEEEEERRASGRRADAARQQRARRIVLKSREVGLRPTVDVLLTLSLREEEGLQG
jgi:hypothetical protein